MRPRSRRCAPRRAPATNAHVVPWSAVRYDLGEIQNRWHLTVEVSNDVNTAASVELYKEDNARGWASWDLHQPVTAISVEQPGAHTLESTCMSITRHEDGMRRTDTFRMNRNPGGHGRVWGTLQVRVGDRTHAVPVPSSLFRMIHGHHRAAR